jgi:hypothetical protein
MSAPPRNEQDGLTRREEISVSGAVLSGAPVGAAAATGAVVTVADLGLHLINGSIHVSALSGSVSAGVAAFFVVAAAGALLRARSGASGRAARWARAHPWKFAVLPAAVVAAITLVLSVMTGGGAVGAVISGVWHGAVVLGLTGAIGAMSRSRSKRP